MLVDKLCFVLIIPISDSIAMVDKDIDSKKPHPEFKDDQNDVKPITEIIQTSSTKVKVTIIPRNDCQLPDIELSNWESTRSPSKISPEELSEIEKLVEQQRKERSKRIPREGEETIETQLKEVLAKVKAKKTIPTKK